MLISSINPADCQKDIAGREKMTGISQFHNSLTGQASANEKIGQAIILRRKFKMTTNAVL